MSVLKEIDVKTRKTLGVRHLQTFLLFLLVVLAYGMRTNLSVGIVAMTDPTINPNVPTYQWDDKSIILSSFFWGYIVPQIGAGQLAQRYGPKWILTLSMIMCGCMCACVPLMAQWYGSWGVIICRIGQGLAQGFFYPSCHCVIAKWIPSSERSRLGTFIYTGNALGTVISMSMTGWIATEWGWPYTFYIYAFAGWLWAVLWAFLGYNSPKECTIISQVEKNYIESDLRGHDTSSRTPWRAIATSLPVWAIIIAHFGLNWGFSILLTEIPTYLAAILKFDIEEDALLSAAPYLIFWLISIVFSSIADYLINEKIVTIGVSRKIFNSVGHFGSALFFLCLAFFADEEKTTLTIFFIYAAIGILSASFCGFQVNHIDLSPNHAATLMGITNGFATISSIASPLSVQYLVTDETNENQWTGVFLMCASIYTLGNIFYVIFGSGEIQSWNTSEKENDIKCVENC